MCITPHEKDTEQPVGTLFPHARSSRLGLRFRSQKRDGRKFTFIRKVCSIGVSGVRKLGRPLVLWMNEKGPQANTGELLQAQHSKRATKAAAAKGRLTRIAQN